MTKKQKQFTFIAFFLLFIMFCILFYFSAQDGNESSTLSSGVALMIIKTFVSDFETISIERQTFLLEAFSAIVRKLAHFSIFFIIGVLSFFATYMLKLKKKYKFLIMFMICSFYAVFDECHQHFIPDRTASRTDVLIDLSGSLFGIILILITFSIINYVHKTENST